MSEKDVQILEEEEYIRNKLYGGNKSNLKKYAELVVGQGSFFELLKYEIITSFFGFLPGAIGLFLRKIFYPFLFREVGKGVIFGRSITFRNTKNIKIGNRVVFDDYCVIDARGAGEKGIVIEDEVIINRGVSIQAKLGEIFIGSNTDIGMFSSIHSQGAVYVGKMITIAGGCKISGGNFQISRGSLDNNLQDDGNSFVVREQSRFSLGPIKIKDKCILGIGTIVLDGVEIGEGCVIGAGSLINKNIPEYSVAAGVPAKIIRSR